MSILVWAVAGALFLYLVVVAPVRGRRNHERLRGALQTDPAARLRYYERANRRKICLALVAMILFYANGRTYGLTLFDASQLGYALPLALGVALGVLLARIRLRKPKSRARMARQSRGFAELLPRTHRERRAWIRLSIIAGVTEEILYRVFVMIVLVSIAPGAGTTVVIAVSAVIFGFAHLYQGPRGMAGTAFLGAVQAVVLLSAGLLPAMALHAFIDLRLLLLPPDFVRSLDQPAEPAARAAA